MREEPALDVLIESLWSEEDKPVGLRIEGKAEIPKDIYEEETIYDFELP